MAHHRGLVLVFLALSVSVAAGFEYKVGGTGEWKATESSSNNSYIQWAQHNRFRVGDSIAFSYRAGNDSVVLVSEKSYNSCDTSSYIDIFADGNTVFTFTRSGPFYFISGNKDNCNKNEKLIVVVMAERSNSTAAVPASSPSPFSSSPPPPSGLEVAPAASSPPNAASSKAVGLVGTVAFGIVSFFYALL